MMNLLGFIGGGFVSIPEKTVFKGFKRNPLSEAEYFDRTNKDLQAIPCPNCSEHGGIFAGFFYIQCNKCLGLFDTPKEFTLHLNGELV